MTKLFILFRTLRAGLFLLAAFLLNLSAPARQPAQANGASVIYLPVIVRREPVPIGSLAIANPSFEDENWVTDWDNGGIQYPSGWTAIWPSPGEVMPFTRVENGVPVPVISDGHGEYIHRYSSQLPPEEWLGEPRALILDGQLVYKAFGFQIQQALTLSQTLTGTADDYARVTVYVLNEDTTEPPLAHDNSIVSVKLGDVEDRRPYGEMITHHDVPGNDRAWNKFVVTAQFPASGQLALTIVMQQNWRTRTDFFIDNLSGEILRAP